MTCAQRWGCRRGRAAGGSRQGRAALEAHYRFLLWRVSALERFPLNRKFLPGDRIPATTLDVLESLTLDVLESLIQAACTRQDHRGLRPQAPVVSATPLPLVHRAARLLADRSGCVLMSR